MPAAQGSGRLYPELGNQPKMTKDQKLAMCKKLLGTQIGESQIYLHKILGHGSFGVVIHALGPRDPKTGRFQEYAVKCMCKLMPIREHILAADEIVLHRKISGHPNVLPFVELVQTDLWFFLVLDYCPEGDLFKEIVFKRRYFGKDDLVRSVYCQILDGVDHCHRNGVYHRDLKPENCLVKNGGETVMVMDFGLATKKDFVTEWGCGSRFYMAPEVYGTNREAYSTAKADIWALGVILVNLVTGRNPWRKALIGDNVYDNFCRDPGALQAILPISDEMNDLLRKIFVEPRLRPSIAEIRADVMKITHFLAPDQGTRQHWEETLERDRDAWMKGDVPIKADALIPKEAARPQVCWPGQAPEPVVKKNAGIQYSDTLVKMQLENEARHRAWQYEQKHINNWRDNVAGTPEPENPGQFEEAAPSWSQGPSPMHSRQLSGRPLCDSVSMESPFPVTPQMPIDYLGRTGRKSPKDLTPFSIHQMRRIQELRPDCHWEHPCLRMANNTLDTASIGPISVDIGMDEIDIVVDGIIEEDPQEAEANPETLGQKVKHMMHRSMRALNSRGGGEPMDMSM